MSSKREKSILDYQDYKQYLLDRVEERRKEEGAVKARLAEIAGCKPAYVSQVLNGSAHLSLEQAEKISRWLKNSIEETRYFLLLVQFERAGTATLRDFFRSEVRRVREKRKVVTNRIPERPKLKEEDQAIYYSSWEYLAVHILTGIPAFQTILSIAKYLCLYEEEVASILAFLEKTGCVENCGDSRFKILNLPGHLPGTSPFIKNHHANWRLQAIRSLDKWRSRDARDLHYSSVIAIRKDDMDRIRTKLLNVIEEIRPLVAASAPEDSLFSYCIDFFELGR